MHIGNALKIALTTVLFTFVCLVIFAKYFGPIPLFVNSVNTTKTDLFTVDGKGEATVIPDTASFSVGITKSSSTVKDAQDTVNNTITKITQDLKNLGVNEKDIKTTDYSVNPNYDFLNGRQNTNGYTVSANLDIKVKPIDKANKAVDISTADGANMVNGVIFTVDDATLKSLEEKARNMAIDDARQKAESIAYAAGIRLGRIVNVQENAQNPRPIPMMAPVGAEKTSDQTQLNPGKNSISTTVTLSYETY